LIDLPWKVATLQGALMNTFMPKPLLTADQVVSLKTDNIVDEKALGLKDLGITPTAMSTILPTYLTRYKPGGRFHAKKRHNPVAKHAFGHFLQNRVRLRT
jgi:hypothetical protein